ncbi:AbrB family transcriptional regulator [Candidatus Woesearchaeota archaeon]|nr:AbrB family transcriptional regulator [Candidatus Woesearchaeota archaeon]
MDVVEREIDSLGRLVIPKAWRKWLGTDVVLVSIGDEVRIQPKRRVRLSDLPKLEVELKSKLDDWHAVHAELLGL